MSDDPRLDERIRVAKESEKGKRRMPEFPGDRRERSVPHFPERRGRKHVYVPPWTVPQLAKYISHSPDFVLSKIHAKEIAATKFGSEWRIPFSEVRRYLLKKNYPLPDEAA